MSKDIPTADLLRGGFWALFAPEIRDASANVERTKADANELLSVFTSTGTLTDAIIWTIAAAKHDSAVILHRELLRQASMHCASVDQKAMDKIDDVNAMTAANGWIV